VLIHDNNKNGVTKRKKVSRKKEIGNSKNKNCMKIAERNVKNEKKTCTQIVRKKK